MKALEKAGGTIMVINQAKTTSGPERCRAVCERITAFLEVKLDVDAMVERASSIPTGPISQGVLLDGPDAIDKARAMLGAQPPGTHVLFLLPRQVSGGAGGKAIGGGANVDLIEFTGSIIGTTSCWRLSTGRWCRRPPVESLTASGMGMLGGCSGECLSMLGVPLGFRGTPWAWARRGIDGASLCYRSRPVGRSRDVVSGGPRSRRGCTG